MEERTFPLFELVGSERVPRRRRRDPLQPARRVGLILLVVLVAAALVAGALSPVVGASAALVGTARDFLGAGPSAEELVFPRLPQRSTIYARDGTVLAKLYLDENRKVVRLGRLKPRTTHAVIAAEDERFYEHTGVDFGAVVRAGMRNLATGEIQQGASTITQQVARNLFEEVGTEETLRRKIREARVAMKLERVYSKDEILEIYLNEIYLGHGVYGIGTAAEWYFGKQVGKLTLSESALLAGLIASPSNFSPIDHRRRARQRRDTVLHRMVEAGFVTERRGERARRARVELSPRMRRILRHARAPFFVEFIKRRILDDPTFGKERQARIRFLFQGGLDIHTTLDPRLQRAGRRAIDRHLPLDGDPESAIVALRPRNGAIRALIGGRNFRNQKFNLASQGRRQPGSAFKPFTLVTALEQGISPLTTYDSSSPKVLPNPGSDPWEVHNASQRGYGKIDLRVATRNSVNVVYAQLIQEVGPRNVVRTARRMGIETELPAVPSLTLGTAPVTPLEMGSAYGTLANRGKRCEPFAIRRIVDRARETVFRSRRDCERAVGAGVAARAVSMLQEAIEQGTGTAANIPWPAFGKTGTTDDYGDAWFVGCTVQICASTWVGHIEGRIPMRNVHGIRVFGGTFPARIWHDFMTEGMDGRPAKAFQDPPPMPQPGEREAAVPDVVGMRVGQARAVLQDAGFDVVVTFEDVRNVKRAREVVAQDPRGGREAIEGSTVRLTALRR